MRYILALAFPLAFFVGAVLTYQVFTAGPPMVLPAPTRLEVAAAGAPVRSGTWISSGTVSLMAQTPGTESTGLDVEVRPGDQSFLDQPTASTGGQPRFVACRGLCPAGTRAAVQVHLTDGRYHWQVRFRNGRGIGPWMTYPGWINIDTTPPAGPKVSSPTDPNPQTIYHQSTMTFQWQASDPASGVAGYSYRLDSDPKGVAATSIRTAQTAVTLQGLPTGTWYFHVRARDNAGNWGPETTFPVRIDVTPPGLARVNFDRFEFNPTYDALHLHFAVTRPAATVRVGVYQQATGALVRMYSFTHLAANQNTTVTWDGKNNAGQPVPNGAYEIYVRAIDPYGHSSLSGWRDLVVDYRRIVVSLSQQRLWAYNGNQLFLTSLVTTGNPKLPTPTGTFHILGFFHPYTFISPWPKTSPYYYKPSKVQYAMLFRDGGYFIHDAPWRSVFGPGSNAQIGTPGDNYTGTHGCVNVPSTIAEELYNWAAVGTVVQINP